MTAFKRNDLHSKDRSLHQGHLGHLIETHFTWSHLRAAELLDWTLWNGHLWTDSRFNLSSVSWRWELCKQAPQVILMLTEAGHPLSPSLSPRHHVAAAFTCGGVDELEKTEELGAGTLTLSSRGPFLHQLAASWDTFNISQRELCPSKHHFLMSIWPLD